VWQVPALEFGLHKQKRLPEGSRHIRLGLATT